jgi:hypothetical protein
MRAPWIASLPFPALLGAILALWSHFQPLSPDKSGYLLELELTSSASGSTWLQYDVGHGRNYHDRRNFWAIESAEPRTYRVPLPSAIFRSFAILPPATVHQKLAGGRILDPDGAVLVKISAIHAAPERDVILFEPAHALDLRAADEKSWASTALDFVICTGLFLLVNEFLRRRRASVDIRAIAHRLASWSSARPRTTLFAIAALAVAVSCHPVLFFGRSFVSPNNGVLCLYDVHPTLPGAPATPFNSWNGSDINATMWAHLPYSVVAHDAVFRDHQLPLWNRFVMSGLTLLGQGQSMIGDPLYWLTVCANGAAWAWDTRFLLSKLLFSWGLGLVVWRSVRHLGIASLLAFSSSFLGFFSFRFNHPAFFSLAYAPWILLCWLDLATATTPRRAGAAALALVAANWLEFNSGTAKEAAMLLLALNAAGALGVLFRPGSVGAHVKKLGFAAVSCTLFLAVSAPLWIVFLDALESGYTIYDQPQANQISPALLIGLFDDLFFRQLMEKEWHVDPSLNFLFLLGLSWAIPGVRTWIDDPTAKACLIVSIGALALAFGVVPPAWIESVPFIKNIVHVDDTFITVAIVPLCVLAGFGFRNCLEKMRAPHAWRSDWRITLILLGGLAALYIGGVQAVPTAQGFGLQLARPTAFSPFFIAYALALFAATATLPWLARVVSTGHGATASAALAAALCLVVLHFRHGQWLDNKFGAYVVNPRARVDLQAASPAVDFLHHQQDGPARVMGFGQILRPGFNIVLKLETPTGSDAVASRALGQWSEAAGLGAIALWWPTVSKQNIAALRPIYDALNVRYYLGSIADADHPAPGLEKIASFDLDVFESKTAWPRAFFTDHLGQYDDVRTLLHDVSTGDGRPFASIRRGDPAAPSLLGDQASRRIVPAHDYHLTTNNTAFTIDAPAAGVAVLNESFIPDNFRALVNGHPVPFFRVNHISKGVSLPGPGTYAVEFQYWPRPLTPALWISAAALAVLILSAGLLYLAPRLKPGSPFA